MPFRKLTKEEMKHRDKPKNVKPLWNLYKNGITQGFVSSFLNCREQTRLAYCEGWSAKGSSSALEFGSVFHHVLSEVHTGKAPDAKTAIKGYWKLFKAGANFTTAEKQELDLLYAQAEAVADAYFRYWSKFDEGKTWVAREKTFSVPYTTADGKTIPLRGRWDGLFEGKHGKLWLHETKTKSTIDQDGIRLTLPFDFQTMLYSYTAEQVYGRKVGGTLYDVIRKPQLKQGKTESPQDFIARIKRDIATQPQHYFMRWEVSLAKNDVGDWVRKQLDPIVSDIKDWFENPERYHYLRPGALYSAWGSRCDLFYAITSQNYYGLYRRKHAYPELVD